MNKKIHSINISLFIIILFLYYMLIGEFGIKEIKYNILQLIPNYFIIKLILESGKKSILIFQIFSITLLMIMNIFNEFNLDFEIMIWIVSVCFIVPFLIIERNSKYLKKYSYEKEKEKEIIKEKSNKKEEFLYEIEFNLEELQLLENELKNKKTRELLNKIIINLKEIEKIKKELSSVEIHDIKRIMNSEIKNLIISYQNLNNKKKIKEENSFYSSLNKINNYLIEIKNKNNKRKNDIKKFKREINKKNDK